MSTRSKRSRDTILGCVAQIKVGGKVVKTEASSPDILRDYANELSQTD